MPGTALLVRNHRVQIYIFHAPEDVFLYLRVLRCKCADQVLDRTPFGALLCAAAGSAALCQTTGTLDKMQIIIIPPANDILFPDQIHGTDQFHTVKIGAVELGHHGLNLRAIEHSHQDGLNHIIIMVPQGDLVAPQIFRLAVQ